MLMNPMGGLALTNDGNAILREINVNHPAAKSMIELARTQDDEVGDGTTSVIILTGEVLSVVSPWLERHVHPTILIRGLYQARDDALTLLRERSRVVDEGNRAEMLSVVKVKRIFNPPLFLEISNFPCTRLRLGPSLSLAGLI